MVRFSNIQERTIVDGGLHPLIRVGTNISCDLRISCHHFYVVW